MKRMDILKKYYSRTLDNNSFKERVKNFFKRKNLFGKMNDDIDCLMLAKDIIKNFRRNEYFSHYDYVTQGEDGKSYIAHNSPDPFMTRARDALMNAIVFFLYWKHEPKDFEFARIHNMLLKAKEELSLFGYSEALDNMYEGNDNQNLNHTGKREYEIFKIAAGQGQCIVINNILENFDIIANKNYLKK